VGVWVQTPYFASAMQGMFDKSWNNMKPASSILN